MNKQSKLKSLLVSIGFLGGLASGHTAELKVGDQAPAFKTKDQDGKEFDLSSRVGKWTVLYFYPKAETPGCTKQACAFRDSIQWIRDQNADVFGISSDDVPALKKFQEHHRLNFTLLSDPEIKIIESYGTKMPVIKMAKRWTFILDPALKIRLIDSNVDPVKDAQKMAAQLKEFQVQ